MIRFSPHLKTSQELLSTFTICCLLDVLAKIRKFEIYTFFLTCSAAEFHWTEIIHVVACQYAEILTDQQVNAMDWSTNVYHTFSVSFFLLMRVGCFDE